MIVQQLLSVVWLVASPQAAKGFFMTPNPTRTRRVESKTSLSSFPANQESEDNNKNNDSSSNDKKEIVRENDLSMFLPTPEEEKKNEGFDPLEFFMTIEPVDESLQKLQEVEDFFREEPMGIMLEEQTGVVPLRQYDHTEHVATTNPVPNENIKMKAHDSETINIEEDPAPKRVAYFNLLNFRSKTKYDMSEEETGVVPSRQYDNTEHVATTNPVANENIKMKTHDSETINIEEDPAPKRVAYFNLLNFRSKTKYHIE